MAHSTGILPPTRSESCRFCGVWVSLCEYADGHLSARWYDAGTDHAHSCEREDLARMGR